MSLTTADPMSRVAEALAAAGCGPRGDLSRLTARCPAHEDRDPSLSVAEGSDRRVLIYCHAGCEPAAVLDALELRWGDLFPVGHRRSTPPPRKPAREKRSPAAGLLERLTAAGYRFNGLITLDRCPWCDAPNPWIRFTDTGGVDVDCSECCGELDVLRAVDARAAIAEAGA